MQLHQLVNMFGNDFQRHYGEKIHKLSLHGGFSCSNRDGSRGRGGCTFCNVAAFRDPARQYLSVAEQLDGQKVGVDRSKRYLAYFQAYTSTYAEVQLLDRLYRQALSQTHIAGLCVGTRPDCVPASLLDLLAGYRDKGYEIWLELRLQSTQDKTLRRINRGHDYACYQHNVTRARGRGLNVCTHLIIGLPGEDATACLDTLHQVVAQGVSGLKLHPLHIVDGSIMARAWRAGRLPTLPLETYGAIAGEMIRHTPPDIIFHRVSANARRPVLLAPSWCENRWHGMLAVYHYLQRHGPQGSALGRPWRLRDTENP